MVVSKFMGCILLRTRPLRSTWAGSSEGQVGSKGVGIVARSKGADLALSLATFVPGVEAAVCINGNSANMVERLKRHGKENFESVSYPGAGHLLEPPYEPFCPSSAHGVLSYIASWGGEPKAHAAAEVHLWKKIQEFFRTHLSCDAAQTKAKL
ncbi:peroxisomal succinyl-coenzyme A thioesterase-like [Pelmatolapia mariae]|uniref:peroxisomal succinyl-coenzyme A thioesterase-like n=1 Tax=Pelmatolapia mariae TaxID=158779 RepID=UPI003211E388